MMTTTLRERPTQPDLSFQAHFASPPAPTFQPPPAPSAPSLVVHGITHEQSHPALCPSGRWVLATCADHANERWIYAPCKRRFCSVCGPRRRKKVAWRIAHGIETLAPAKGAAWFVGTWAHKIDKPTAVKAQARFIAWLRRTSQPGMQYAVTWELTKRGRLHINIIMAPWNHVPQQALSQAWQRLGGGKIVWITRVGAGIGQEAAKSRQDVSAYFAKWEQLVRHGRAASYSKGWPKLPETPFPVRQGVIHYAREWQREPWQHPPSLDPADIQLSLWEETRPNEYQRTNSSDCQCFNLRLPDAHCPSILEPG